MTFNKQFGWKYFQTHKKEVVGKAQNDTTPAAQYTYYDEPCNHLRGIQIGEDTFACADCGKDFS